MPDEINMRDAFWGIIAGIILPAVFFIPFDALWLELVLMNTLTGLFAVLALFYANWHHRTFLVVAAFAAFFITAIKFLDFILIGA